MTGSQPRQPQRIVFYNKDGTEFQVHSTPFGVDAEDYAKKFTTRYPNAKDYVILES